MTQQIIQPPTAASRDEGEFFQWLKAIGSRLIIAGLGDIQMMPMMTENEDLILMIDTDPETAARIKRILYH